MTPADTAEVLALVQAYSGRTVGEIDIAAWHQIIGDLNLDDCRAAVVGYFRDHHEWLTVDVVRQAALVERRKRAGRDRQAQLGGPPGFCGVPGCGCTPTVLAIANANAGALQRSIRNVFRAAP